MNNNNITITEFWTQCLQLLQNEVSEQAFNQHLLPLTVGEENNDWVIYGKNQFAVNLVRAQYAAKIEQAKAFIGEELPNIVFKVGCGASVSMDSGCLKNKENKENISSTLTEQVSPLTQETSPKSSKTTPISKKNALEMAMENLSNTLQSQKKNWDNISTVDPQVKETKEKKQLEKQKFEQTNLNAEYTFDTLVIGKGNELAARMAMAIAEKPAEAFCNPFFVYGSTGLGKTHLVQAIGHELLKQHAQARVYYITADKYIKNLMNAVRNHSWDTFKQLYLNYDLLIIDDIQFIAGKERTMEEFFYLFEHFYSKKQQIILTCDQLPSGLEEMDDRLKSRFAWGMTLPIEPPELEMRVNILERKAQQVEMTLENDAALLIAQNVKKSVRELEGALNRVVARCRFEQRHLITKEIVEQTIQDLIASNYKLINPELIQKAVADRYSINVRDILGKKRSRNLARPRQLAMALTKELTHLSLPAIGEAFGGRDHTTVMHAIKTINKLREEDPECQRDYNELLILIQH